MLPNAGVTLSRGFANRGLEPPLLEGIVPTVAQSR